MKKVILLASLVPLLASGQVIFNFESGIPNDWIQCQENHWITDNLQALNGSFSLHHNYDDPLAGISRIGFQAGSLKPASGVTRWSIKVRHGYDPSSSNNWSLFLMSDSEPCSMGPGEDINGFAFGVNLSGYDDTLTLWKVKGGNLSAIVRSGINWQSIIGTQDYATLVIERSPGGIWKTEVYDKNGTVIDTSRGLDDELFDVKWCGIYYKYSSARDRLLWVDDIEIDGVFQEDREPPSVKSVMAAGKNAVDIILDEEPSSAFLNNSNFWLNGKEESAIGVVPISRYRYRIFFRLHLLNKSVNRLTITELCDEYSNCTGNVISSFIVTWAEPGDVIISELMPDPMPAVSLPEKEYIEIFNNSDYSVNIGGWTLRSDDKSIEFPPCLFMPREYLIVCSPADTTFFSVFSRVVGLKSFPVLTDAGKVLALYDSTGALIHGIRYAAEWYDNTLKADGGWSLEMVDERFPFHYPGNWKASRAPDGGTPGRVNSVKGLSPDISFDGIVNLFTVDPLHLSLKFSEPVRNSEDEIIESLTGDIAATAVSCSDLLRTEFEITLADQLKEGTQYIVELSDKIRDFSGNNITDRKALVGLPSEAAIHDLLFNELLFNPFPGEPDYIELYNNGGSILDLSDLYLLSVNLSSGDTSSIVSVSAEPRCIFPGEYYAVTIAREMVLSRYYSSGRDRVFEVDELPSMPDDGGYLVLINKKLEHIDAVRYSENMHFPLFSSNEGISLEKLRPGMPSGEADYWHSASETSGWGTPGAPNSIMTLKSGEDGKIKLSSTRITPDNDGFEDVLIVDMIFPGPGNVITVSIFDENGNFVARPAYNLFAGPEVSVVWDGTAEDGFPVRRGIYIIFIKIYDDKGRTRSWKGVCSVIR